MRLDYHEKKVARDNTPRKPLQKNRARKEPVGMFVLLSVVALVLTYGAGVATGWFVFKGDQQTPSVVAQPVKKVEPVPVPIQPDPAAADAPLTFYDTLPAGGKGAIGSGMNLKLDPAPVSASRPAPVAAPAAAQAPEEKRGRQEKQEAPDKQEKDKQEKTETQEKQDKQEKQDVSTTRYLVQIASYRDKAEAEAAQARLSGRGVAAYVSESKHPERGVWYRVRVGRNLTRAEAEQLASRSGKGSAIIAE